LSEQDKIPERDRHTNRYADYKGIEKLLQNALYQNSCAIHARDEIEAKSRTRATKLFIEQIMEILNEERS
jgi:hypothetical protein